jgi:serine/threonine-protein kinase
MGAVAVIAGAHLTFDPAAAPPPAGRIELPDGFSYVHEPLDTATRMPYLGDRTLVDALKDRINHSSGGAFLVTGFRGVGKTTLIQRVLAELEAECPPNTYLVTASIGIARPLPTNDVLFAIVRRIYEELHDHGILEQLPDHVQEAITTSYLRTSLSVKNSTGRSNERGLSLEIGASAFGLGPTVGASTRRTADRAVEMSYLTYSDTDAEHDLLRIIRLLRRSEGFPPREEPVRRSRWGGRPEAVGQPFRIRLVVVIDEIDKLTASPGGDEAVERLVSELKSVLSTTGVHFVVLAGPDLSDIAARDAERGNGVYESVFSSQLYVPCQWDSATALLARLAPGAPADLVDSLTGHLEFKARGVLRRLFQELNSFVRWTGGRPALIVDAAESNRVHFYAKLSAMMRPLRESFTSVLPVEADRRWLALHYVLDWIIRTDGRPFTTADVERSLAGGDVVTPLIGSSIPALPGLLATLADEGFVELIRTESAESTLIPHDAGSGSGDVFRLSAAARRKLVGFAAASEQERSSRPPLRLVATPDEDDVALGVVGERYVLVELLGRGGTGSVYRAIDQKGGMTVAVKMLDLLRDLGPTELQRFRRSSEIALRLRHPGIVQTYAVINDGGPRGIVMELLDGVPLDRYVAGHGLGPATAVQLVVDLLDALQYLLSESVSRIDLKPHNVVVRPDGRPVIVDLGLALTGEFPDSVTSEGQLLGTPLYMAPEQVAGGRTDIRTDLFAAGLLLIECLTGRPAKTYESIPQLLHLTMTVPVDVDALPVSPELREVLRTATRLDPADRYATPHDMATALHRTPEGQAVIETQIMMPALAWPDIEHP